MDTHNQQRLAGKVALVTGAGRGIGRAIALALAEAGASLCCAARTLEQVRSTAGEIERRGGRAIAVPVDVADEASLSTCVQRCRSELGGIDLLVANAGVGGVHATVDRVDAADWRHTIDVNLTGAFLSVRAVVPAMVERGAGNIILVGSGAGRRAARGMSAYAASKAALAMLTRAFAQDLADRAILVNELIPGPVQTELLGERLAQAITREGVEWLKNPEDVVPLALFLATLPPNGPTGQSYSLCRREL